MWWPDDLRDFRRFRAVYGAGQFRWGSPATTPAKRPGETNTCQTWTERQVLRLARLGELDSDRPIAASAAGNV
ncbi:hypothetical protein Mesil_1189 [Allomeiothermus silvanus DSM 9946]|uniref:Uncharacterized protein n=1 Tax=Allomeiothermus silvanus (strain ATCC 700542 / DSM 9946 / NBRC 106475 / NCIMB 13440 / VI-R2) TaxID=526227 RepID=D7BDT6_ALLS1|nr:hypothetical protein [Allomeiothermus silvanus]ADH63087.1 hypothetical protein Mesil_1189 [Allomeiothermus silvanus DSM 9946]